MVEISVSNRQRRVRFDLAWLKALAPIALAECWKHPAPPGETVLASLDAVEVSVVSDAKISALHEQFMQIAGATDVITFEHGEIIISAETARRNAADFAQPLEHELALYIIHGLLHLHGHGDQAPDEAKRMRKIQDRVLTRCLTLLARQG